MRRISVLGGVFGVAVWAAGAAGQMGPGVPAAGQTSAAAAGTGASAAGANEVLAEQIRALASAPDVARAHWGVIVTGLDGSPIAALNEGQLFQPASNTKLYTTSAAMALLGPEQRLSTTVTGVLDAATGTVRGDLTLVGAGDANLDSADLPYVAPADRPKPPPQPKGAPPAPHTPNPMRDIHELVEQLVQKGVKQVRGNIVGDDTLFTWEPYPQDWSIDDAVWGFGAPVSALTIADNELRLSIAPATFAGVPAVITLEEAVPYYSILNETRTVATKAEATGVEIARSIGSRVLRVYGTIALKDAADIEHVAIEDPAEYAAMTLKAALVERGIAVKGVVRVRHRTPADATGFLTTIRAAEKQAAAGGAADPCASAGVPAAPAADATPAAPVLATHVSEPLVSDVTYTNKVSQNLHAELLLHLLATRSPCGRGSTVEGAVVRYGFLTHAGLDKDDFVFFDGSGLSGHDLTTPRATARLLAYAAHDPATGQPQPWFAQWRATLPVGGVDGSLEGRFKDTPLKGHLFAKTGTLGEARALSGYMECASGRTVIFSIMVGDFVPGTGAVRDTLDKMVAAIAAGL